MMGCTGKAMGVAPTHSTPTPRGCFLPPINHLDCWILVDFAYESLAELPCWRL